MPAIERAEAIARTFTGFVEGRNDDIDTVRGWVESVIRGGSWRFSDPEGVAQDVQLELLRIARGGRIEDPGSFQKFVYTVTKRTCVDVYHRERRRRRTEQPESEVEPPGPDHENPAAALEHREQYRLLLAVFQRLPEACRQLWIWVYGDGLPAIEVARRLGITVSNARVRVHRCLEQARQVQRDQAPWSAAPVRH